MKHILVIGAGFAGLSTSALLAKAGYDVLVVEKNHQPGGRAMLFSCEGFNFDMGPSWYLMPEVFERLFRKLGSSVNEELELRKLEPAYKLFFRDGHLVINGDLKKTLKTFEALGKGNSKKVKRYLDQAKYNYDVAMQEFLYKDYTSIFQFFNARLLLESLKLNIFRNLQDHVGSYLTNGKIQKVLTYNTLFLGCAPHRTPAMYSILAYVDLVLGVQYPMGGLNAVAKAIEKSGKTHGVKFNYNEPVTKIIVKDGKAVGVETNKKSYYTDSVIVTSDYWHADQKLLDKRYRTYSRKYWEGREVAPGAYMIYLGLDKRVPELEHHNLFLEDDWDNHFDEIFKKPSWPERPNYYICVRSKTDPSSAPAGKENIVILVPIAPGLKDDKQSREDFEEMIFSDLEDRLGKSFRNNIQVKKTFAISEFSDIFNAYKGTGFGLGHTLFQTAFFRPGMRSKRVKNLYFGGQYTHPGIGVPMVLIASEILSGIIQNEV
jgi:phytoene desaturase